MARWQKLSKLTLQAKRVFCSVKLYENCKELSLYRFIKIYETDDLGYLIIKGYPTIEQLKATWEKIYAEYSSLIKDSHQGYLLSAMKEVAFLGNKLYLIETIVNQLYIAKSDILIGQLRDMGLRIDDNEFGSSRYYQSLQSVITQAKRYIVQMQMRRKELENLKKDSGDKEEGEYDMMLTELSKFQGYRIIPEQTSVSEFCAILNRFKTANKPHGPGKIN
jgi:hypothetical protein